MADIYPEIDIDDLDSDFEPDEPEQDLDPDETFEQLNPASAAFLDQLVIKTILFCEELSGLELRPYQRAFAYRFIESVILHDADTITALFSRQSGKSECVAVVVAGIVVLFPKLAQQIEMLEDFKDGVWVGVFAPVDGQSDFVFGRIKDKLTSPRAKQFMIDPEIDDTVDAKSKLITLASGSLIRRQTANTKAKIEGATYHVALIDEAQDTDNTVVSKSISPMLASTAGTMVKIGTPSFVKGHFYDDIRMNRQRGTMRGVKQNHFQADYKLVQKYNPRYTTYIKKEKIKYGEDSDYFQMCVAPETKVLTADLRHIPARDVSVGMKLVGFDEHRPGKGLHRQFKETEVEYVWDVTLPSYRISLSDGTEVVASAEHPWLVSTAGSRTVWKQTQDLLPTDCIFKISEVWSEEHTYESGYLAAAFDGEGHLSLQPTQMGFSQRENLMWDEVRKHLATYGFGYWESQNRQNDVQRLNISGKAEILRFLGQIRPNRLLGKLDLNRLGSIGRHDRRLGGFDHPRVEKLTFLGDQDLVAFQTTTRTFVAEGLASHNSYALRWMLDRGMLIGEDELAYLADPHMELVRAWTRTPVVVGIDPARVKDHTVVTVCWVDWDHPDPAGYREHRVLNWLEIADTAYEEQYYKIVDFLAPYDVAFIGVDAQGMGGPFAERLQLMFGHRTSVVPLSSDAKNQHERWTHLIQLLQRNMILYPGHYKARRTRCWKRFKQQMEDAEKVIKGQFMLVQAPEETRNANDDFVDSLALACAMSMEETVAEVEVMDAPWFRQ
jgi:hypothetical protein